MSFSDALVAYSAAKLSELKADSDRVRWRSSIERHALPYIGNILVAELTVQDILRVMEPIWEEKTETARRVRSRIEAILSWATVAGYRTGDNPARWRGNIATLLPKPKKANGKNHHPAVSLSDAQGWFAALRERKGKAARAMEFLTLCASRSGEVRGMVWSEIDFRSNIWTIPAERMKAEREHRVPLSEAAIKILEAQPRLNGTPLVFPGSKGQMSDMTLSAVMRRMHKAAISDAKETGQDTETARWCDPRSGRRAVPHGLRSTFRDWVAELTDYPREMAEIALAHQVGSEVERAYRRGDMLEKRRGMMNDWVKFLKGELDELG